MSRSEHSVAVGSQIIGTLRESSYRAAFSFVPDYQARQDRPVLGQWFEDRLWQDRFEPNVSGLPVFFENLLPSDYLRRLIRVQHHLDDSSNFDVLAAVGGDLPGAVVIGDRDGAVPISSVGFAVDETLQEQAGSGRPLAFSLAGLQLKFSVVKDGRWLTLPVEGELGESIAKVPTKRSPSGLVENEFSVMRWADAAGFDVPAIELLSTQQLRGAPAEHVHGESMFVIKRFDRSDGERIHQEDFAQILGVRPEDAVSSLVPFGYSEIGRVVRGLLGQGGVQEYLRRLVFMTISGNGDAHLKNWSVRYPNRQTPVWAPLYDQVATAVFDASPSGPTMRLGSAKHWHDVDRPLLVELAESLGLAEGSAGTLIDEAVESIRDAWNELAPGLPLLTEHRVALTRHFSRLPLLRGYGSFVED